MESACVLEPLHPLKGFPPNFKKAFFTTSILWLQYIRLDLRHNKIGFCRKDEGENRPIVIYIFPKSLRLKWTFYLADKLKFSFQTIVVLIILPILLNSYVPKFRVIIFDTSDVMVTKIRTLQIS